MTSIEKLISSARAYRSKRFIQDQPLYDRLVREGQSPSIMMIACSDSRVDPSIIFDSEPGQIFMVRNVASLVPPYTPDSGCHGTSAALEFGVRALEVEYIVVLGHGHCGGVRALLTGDEDSGSASDFIGSWLTCAADVRNQLLEDAEGVPQEELARRLEIETVRMSVQNLLTFPWIEDRVRKGATQLFGWHFDIAEGVLCDVGSGGAPVVLSS